LHLKQEEGDDEGEKREGEEEEEQEEEVKEDVKEEENVGHEDKEVKEEENEVEGQADSATIRCVGYLLADGTPVTCQRSFAPNRPNHKRCKECRGKHYVQHLESLTLKTTLKSREKRAQSDRYSQCYTKSLHIL
jgi:nucleoside 2-deoxyribosyltransferase